MNLDIINKYIKKIARKHNVKFKIIISKITKRYDVIGIKDDTVVLVSTISGNTIINAVSQFAQKDGHMIVDSEFKDYWGAQKQVASFIDVEDLLTKYPELFI